MYRSTFDFAKWKKDVVWVEVDHQDISLTLYFGPTPAHTLKLFTQDTGRSLIPPTFAFGPWNQLGGEWPGENHFYCREFVIE